MKKLMLSVAALALLFAACNSNEKTTESEATTTDSSANVSTEAPKFKYEVTWEAFKTPAKKGVKGGFTDIKLDSIKNDAANFPAVLEGAVFDINGMSVSSGDAIRDNNLKNNFFSKLMGNITGKFGAFKAGKVPVQFTMAGVTKEIILDYQDMGDSLKVKGTIDMLKDFKAETAYKSIAEACKDYHEGKTWTDVNISAKISK